MRNLDHRRRAPYRQAHRLPPADAELALFVVALIVIIAVVVATAVG